MPVHRLPGGRGRVLANVAELDAWKRSGALQTTEPLPAAPPPVSVIDARPATPRRLWRRFAGWLGAAALVALGLLAIHYWPGKPVSYRVERDTFIALDAQRRECWRKVFPYPLLEANSPELSSRYTWIGDLDGDGRNEVLFAPHPLTSQQESTPLICYDDRGVERWRFVNRRHVRTSARKRSPQRSFGRHDALLVLPVRSRFARARRPRAGCVLAQRAPQLPPGRRSGQRREH